MIKEYKKLTASVAMLYRIFTEQRRRRGGKMSIGEKHRAIRNGGKERKKFFFKCGGNAFKKRSGPALTYVSNN